MAKSLYTAPATVKANGIDLVYDAFGDRSAVPVLLIMGLGAQMIAWDEEFCTGLAQRGFWVIRYDNRDSGLSTKFADAGLPDIPALLRTVMQGGNGRAPYSLKDMAEDAVGLLDALEIESAHIVGVSMGGMIAQLMAVDHPERVRTLTSIMSSTSEPGLPQPKREAVAGFATPTPTSRADYIEHAVLASAVLNGTGFRLDELRVRERAARAFDRSLYPEGTARQLAAILASGGRKEALRSLTVPALVIHGDADPLLPVEGGIDTADAIPGSELLIIGGMGHDLPPAVWPRVVDAFVQLTEREA